MDPETSSRSMGGARVATWRTMAAYEPWEAMPAGPTSHAPAPVVSPTQDRDQSTWSGDRDNTNSFNVPTTNSFNFPSYTPDRKARSPGTSPRSKRRRHDGIWDTAPDAWGHSSLPNAHNLGKSVPLII